jgi:hypothetical protein
MLETCRRGGAEERAEKVRSPKNPSTLRLIEGDRGECRESHE